MCSIVLHPRLLHTSGGSWDGWARREGRREHGGQLSLAADGAQILLRAATLATAVAAGGIAVAAGGIAFAPGGGEEPVVVLNVLAQAEGRREVDACVPVVRRQHLPDGAARAPEGLGYLGRGMNRNN